MKVSTQSVNFNAASNLLHFAENHPKNLQIFAKSK